VNLLDEAFIVPGTSRLAPSLSLSDRLKLNPFNTEVNMNRLTAMTTLSLLPFHVPSL